METSSGTIVDSSERGPTATIRGTMEVPDARGTAIPAKKTIFQNVGTIVQAKGSGASAQTKEDTPSQSKGTIVPKAANSQKEGTYKDTPASKTAVGTIVPAKGKAVPAKAETTQSDQENGKGEPSFHVRAFPFPLIKLLLHLKRQKERDHAEPWFGPLFLIR